MRGKWPLVAGIVVLLAVVSGVFTVLRQTPQAPQPVPRSAEATPPPVLEITLTGKIQARKTVDLPVPIDGVVERFMADVGDDVFEGELLALIRNAKGEGRAKAVDLDAQRAQAHVTDLSAGLSAARLEASRLNADATRAKAELDQATKVYQRQQLLYQEGATPRLTFEKAEADFNKAKTDTEEFGSLSAAADNRIATLTKELEGARALAQGKSQELDEAKADLGAGEVHSTVNGVVLARHAEVGEAVSRELKDVFQIGTDLGSLAVVITPEPAVRSRIKPGQAVLVQVAPAPEPIPGVVREMKGDEIFVDFANPLPAIKPGLIAQVKLKLQ